MTTIIPFFFIFLQPCRKRQFPRLKIRVLKPKIRVLKIEIQILTNVLQARSIIEWINHLAHNNYTYTLNSL